MEYATLKYEQEDAVGILTLNRPDRLNAISEEMKDELEGFWVEKMYDLGTRVIIFTGAGERGFCAGTDMKEAPQQYSAYSPDEYYSGQMQLGRIMLLMRQVPQPIICTIHKAAVGGGFCFAMAADVRIITPEARFSAAFINIGNGGADAGSSYFLPRLIGTGRAYEFLLTGDFMNADEAMKLGFASRMVPYNELMPTAMAMARNMASKNPLGLRLTKEAINQDLDAGGLEPALKMEDRNQTLIGIANRLANRLPFSR